MSRQLGLRVDIKAEKRQGFEEENKDSRGLMTKLSGTFLFKRRAGKMNPVNKLGSRVGREAR